MSVPSILTDMNAFFKDESFVGICNTITLPKVAYKTSDFTLAGVAGDIERSLHKLEKLEAEVTVSDYNAKVIDLLGQPESKQEEFRIRGSLDVNGEIKAIMVKLKGLWKSMEFNEFKPESEATLKFAIVADVYEFEMDNNQLIYIDKKNYEVKINGVDRTKAIREALGI
ncbi:phage major tail tube protein [Spartinivicinus poritis]|uniref:Phage major tail tube protein n=1 Tax=Spartinivicinus poritis TaxID=2994640 RepID=A0ABT5UEJ4_9GAMM|nr:phage major tail tube protein [Spartinivicinus sp. A2-2]MDE1464783.1 phage major tail tube protein [Spartinivicinus sp. A2-2]